MDVANRLVSYSDLRQKAFQLAATLQKYELSDQPPLTAVFGYRSVTAFAGILAALLRGHGYVPLCRGISGFYRAFRSTRMENSIATQSESCSNLEHHEC